jgi:hypothetical protein
MQEVRRVSPAAGANPGLKVEPIFVTVPDLEVWEEPNLTASSAELQRSYEQTKKGRELKEMVPVVVAVSETNPRTDLPPGHAPVSKDAPRLLVVGAAEWIGDEGIESPGGGTAVDLFASSVSWLQGRADLGADDSAAKQRSEFTLQDKVRPGQTGRLIWLPLGLIVLTVSAVGGGIWLVRRR